MGVPAFRTDGDLHQGVAAGIGERDRRAVLALDGLLRQDRARIARRNPSCGKGGRVGGERKAGARGLVEAEAEGLLELDEVVERGAVPRAEEGGDGVFAAARAEGSALGLEFREVGER